MRRRSMPCLLLIGLAVVPLLVGSAAYAHQVHRATAHYGGQVTDAGRYHVELLVDENRYLRIYVRESGGMIVAPDDIAVRAVVRHKDGTDSIAVVPSSGLYSVSTKPINVTDYRSIEVHLDVAYGGRVTAHLRRP